MNTARKTLVFAFLLIFLGTGWLFTNLGVFPEIDWVWTMCLAGIGLTVFAAGAFDKLTFVVGSFFLGASGLSLLRQTGRINIEIPPLTILVGVLLLIARHPAAPVPRWLLERPASQNG